jgi:SAM-dependent methyltransferase
MEQPQIWHYGLIAREWVEFATDGNHEAQFFKGKIEAYGQPALDLGCGTDRLLILLVKTSLDVDGCDYSQDMLDQCAAWAKNEGFSPQLYAQPMHELDLPRRYKTIFACGLVGLGGSRRLTLQSMQRCYDYLRPGGVFVFDYSPRWNAPPASRHALPQEWPISSERQRMSDETELEMVTRTVVMDPLEDVATRQIRARLWQNGVMIKEEIHTQKTEGYSKNELVLMLEKASFSEIMVNGDYCDEPATAGDKVIIFVAQK